MSKYHNKRVKRPDGLSFDSQAEAKRYAELELLEKEGLIFDLQLHPRFLIVPAFERLYRKSRARYYVADFSYQEGAMKIVEDVKGGSPRVGGGTCTPLWSLKWTLAQYLFPDYEFRVVER